MRWEGGGEGKGDKQFRKVFLPLSSLSFLWTVRLRPPTTK